MLLLLLLALAADLDRVVDGLQKRYASVKQFSADFVQIYRSRDIERVERGQVYMKKPGKMRWEYREPEEKLFVSDGKRVYLYLPQEQQVQIRDFSADEAQSAPILFLLGRGELAKEFEPSWEERENKIEAENHLIRLTPRELNSNYAYLVLELAPRDYSLERLIIVEHGGDRSEFRISNFKANVKLDDGLFKFKIPKGVEILRGE